MTASTSPQPWHPDPASQEPRALYVHVPFCRRRCGYCNFTVIADRDDLHQRYVEAVLREASRRTFAAELETVYLGGGTPTQLGPVLLLDLLSRLRRISPWSPTAEVTIEANPEDVDDRLLEACRRAGATRISLGVQSFDDAKLRRLEREHAPRQAIAALQAARRAGFQTSLDLIFAAPDESPSQWRDDLQEALRLRPDHVSTYGLTFEKGAAFWGRLRRDVLRAAGEEVELEMYLDARRQLTEAGYEHYEVSNFALPNRRCQHNLTYWRGASYGGLGAGAARFLALQRQVNHRSTLRYLKLVEADEDPTAESEQLDLAERRRERLVFGLRMLEGVRWNPADRQAWETHDPATWTRIRKLEQHGALQSADHRLRLTESGLVVSDWVAGELLTP